MSFNISVNFTSNGVYYDQTIIDPYNEYHNTNPYTDNYYVSSGAAAAFRIDFDIEFETLYSSTSGGVTAYDFVTFYLLRSNTTNNFFNPGGITVPDMNGGTRIPFYLPNTITTVPYFGVENNFITPPGWSYSRGATMSRLIGYITTPLTSLNINEGVRMYIAHGKVNYGSGIPYLKINSSEFRTYQQVLNISDILPVSIKQKDFFSSICKMFNLYVTKSKTIQNHYIIEPRDDFYNKGNVIKDWTLKLDESKEVDGELLANTQFRTNYFTYKPDNDIFNQDYTARTIRTFGEYKYEIDNETNFYECNT